MKEKTNPLGMSDETFKKLTCKAINEGFITINQHGIIVPDRDKIQAELSRVKESVAKRESKKWYQFWK